MSDNIHFICLILVYPGILLAQYQDPGSMSILFQFLLVMLTFLIFYFKRIIKFFSKIVKRNQQEQDKHE
jgi:hypothetical protein